MLCLFTLDYDDPHTLVVLVEEEIIFIDLRSEGWPVFRAPYLATLHSSAITCSAHVTNVPKTFWTKLSEAGNQQMSLGYSSEVITASVFVNHCCMLLVFTFKVTMVRKQQESSHLRSFVQLTCCLVDLNSVFI